MTVDRAAKRASLVAMAGVLIAGLLGVSIPSFAQGPAPDAFALPSDDAVPGDVALAVDDTPARAEDQPGLDEIAVDAETRAAALPQSEWDIPYLADTLDYDYLRAFAFVRDSIAFDPYRGVLRGAEGTLAARAGNAYDRALLLGTLLDGMQVAYRFAFADLDDATVERLLARSMQPAASPLPQPGIDLTPMFDPTTLETRASRDYARLRSVLGDQITTIGSDHPTDLASAIRHHVWIQAAVGSQWVDLDPSMPDAVAGTPLATAVSTASTIPPEDHQVVTLTMTARSFQDGTPIDQVVLDVTLDAADAASRDIFLFFSPDVSGLGGTILETLSGDVSWRPELLIDGETTDGTAFRAGGTGTDVFGDPTGAPDLVSLRLTIGRSDTSGGPDVATRTIIDRVPAGVSADAVTADQLLPMIADDAGPVGMAQVMHLMVSTGGADRRDYSIQRSQSADFTAAVMTSEGATEGYELSDLLWPVAASDQSLVVASESLAVAALGADGRFRGYVGAPRVFLGALGRDPHEPNALFNEIDLALDDVMLVSADPAGPGEVARRQLWYGALETALETQLGLRRAAAFDPAGLMTLGPSIGDPTTQQLLTPADITGAAGGPVALRGALEGGLWVVAPLDVSSAGSWWTIDPTTATTRSVLDPGLGGVRSVTWTSSSTAGRTTDTVMRGGGPKGPRPGGTRQGNFRYRAPKKGANEYFAVVFGVSLTAFEFFFGLGFAVVASAVVAWMVL